MATLTLGLAIPTGFVAGIAASKNGPPGFSYAVTVGVILTVSLVVAGFVILFLELRRSLEMAVEWLLLLPQDPEGELGASDRPSSTLRLLGAISALRISRAMKIFSPRMTRFSDIESSYSPIFCCTDLASGSHFYLGPSFVAGLTPSIERQSSATNVIGSAPELPIATAVAASAAFPVVFRPTVIDARDLGLPVRRGVVDETIVLADGGLFDNFGVSIIDAGRRADLDRLDLQELGPAPDLTIVIDCGQPSHQRQRKRQPGSLGRLIDGRRASGELAVTASGRSSSV